MLIKGIPQPKHPTSVQIKVGDLLDLYESGVIFDYAKNRGTRPGKKLNINSGPLKSMKEHGFEPGGFGAMTIAKHSENEYEIADGHSRLNALIKYLGELLPQDQRSIRGMKVSVVVINGDEHAKAYQLNGMQKSQTGREKILNTDTVAGSTVERMLKHHKLENLTPDGWWQPIYHILYTCNRQFKDHGITRITMQDVKTQTQSAEKQKDVLVVQGKTYLADTVKAIVGDAVKWYLGLIDAVDNHPFRDTGSPKEIIKLLNQNGMMQFFILDFIGDKLVTTRKYKDILNTMDNPGKLLLIKGAASVVARRNEAAAGVSTLETLLKKQTRSSSKALQEEEEVYEEEVEFLSPKALKKNPPLKKPVTNRNRA